MGVSLQRGSSKWRYAFDESSKRIVVRLGNWLLYFLKEEKRYIWEWAP
jgi:hypothetical protein